MNCALCGKPEHGHQWQRTPGSQWKWHTFQRPPSPVRVAEQVRPKTVRPVVAAREDESEWTPDPDPMLWSVAQPVRRTTRRPSTRPLSNLTNPPKEKTDE